MINKTALNTAKLLIEDIDNLNCYNIKQARLLLAEIEKQSGIVDWIKNPMLQTVMSLLTPFIGKNYKVEQAVKLLIEAFKEIKS